MKQLSSTLLIVLAALISADWLMKKYFQRKAWANGNYRPAVPIP